MAVKEGGSREMCVLGIRKRAQQLPFSISCPGMNFFIIKYMGESKSIIFMIFLPLLDMKNFGNQNSILF